MDPFLIVAATVVTFVATQLFYRWGYKKGYKRGLADSANIIASLQDDLVKLRRNQP